MLSDQLSDVQVANLQREATQTTNESIAPYVVCDAASLMADLSLAEQVGGTQHHLPVR